MARLCSSTESLVDFLLAVLAHLKMVSVTANVAELPHMLGYHGVFCSV